MTQLAANLDDHVREALRNKILAGELDGGDHLSELKLSKEFNVSRTPVREALCALAADGLIEMVPHRGAFVRTITSSEQDDQRFAFVQILALTARVAAQRSTIDSIMALEAAISGMDTTDTTAFTKAFNAASTVIRQTSGSTSLDEVLTSLERCMLAGTTNTAQMKEIYQEWNNILSAVKNTKAETAETSMKNAAGMYYGYSETSSESDITTETTVN